MSPISFQFVFSVVRWYCFRSIDLEASLRGQRSLWINITGCYRCCVVDRTTWPQSICSSEQRPLPVFTIIVDGVKVVCVSWAELPTCAFIIAMHRPKPFANIKIFNIYPSSSLPQQCPNSIVSAHPFNLAICWPILYPCSQVVLGL